jgi:hypothetical protein
LAPCPSQRAPLATSRAPPKGLADHNISPRLRKQLVLELEIGVVAAKLLQLLPCGVLVRQPALLDTDMPDATPQLGAHSSLRLWKDAAMEK